MSPGRWLLDWRVAFAVSALAHVVLLALRVDLSDSAEEELEFIDFEVAEPVFAEPMPEPPKEMAPAGPKDPDPQADPDKTSVASNRDPEPDAPAQDVPLVTGLALDADQLVGVGGMAVRVGNTDASGYDADVAPGAIAGFEGGGAGGGDGAGAGSGRYRKAQLLRSFEPDYPRELVNADVTGQVILRVEVLPNGRAGDVSVVSGHPELARAAVAAVQRFRWRPARSGPEPVGSVVLIDVRFRVGS